MLVGNPNWQRYWLESVYARLWTKAGTDGIGVDGVFADIVSHPKDWADLAAQPHPVFAAMDEGSFVHPWGRPDRFNFRTEEQWLLQVRTMRSLKHVRALMNVHGNVRSQAQDMTRMDATDADGNRAWDVFWYALTSFLQGYDDVRQNAYLNFTVWGYQPLLLVQGVRPALSTPRPGARRDATGGRGARPRLSAGVRRRLGGDHPDRRRFAGSDGAGGQGTDPDA